MWKGADRIIPASSLFLSIVTEIIALCHILDGCCRTHMSGLPLCHDFAMADNLLEVSRSVMSDGMADDRQIIVTNRK